MRALTVSVGLLLGSGCTPMFRADVGYAGSLERDDRHAVAADVALAYESLAGVEVAIRGRAGPEYGATALYAGLLLTWPEEVRPTLRAGLHLVQLEWFDGRTITGGGSPSVEVALRIQLTGPRLESRGGYVWGGGTYYAAQGLFLNLAAGLEYIVRPDAPGEGFAHASLGLSYAFGAEPPPAGYRAD